MLWKQKEAPLPKPVQIIPTTPIEYPDGAVVETDTARWYIKGKFKFLIPTDRVFKSWSFPLVVKGSDASLGKYIKNGQLGFRSGSLLYNDGRYYFVTGSLLRKISTPDVFVHMGLDTRSALWVSDEELKLHKVGEVF